MAIKDISSNLNLSMTNKKVIASNTTTYSDAIDTAFYELGVFLSALCAAFTDGSYAITLEESDSSGSGYTAVAAANYIGDTSITLAAATADAASLKKLGVFGTKRYLRFAIVSTGVTTGATLILLATQAAEVVPTT